MNFDKISVTLYDLLGYLLPGYILVMALAVLESTFLGSTLLTLQGIKSNPLPFSVVAYFLGQFCHAMGTTLKTKLRPHAKTIQQKIGESSITTRRKRRLERWLAVVEPCGAPIDENLETEVEKEICAAFEITPDQLGEAGSRRDLNTYLLADGFILASGVAGEREIFQAREGFFKAATVAFLLLAALFGASILVGGASINRTATDAVGVNWWQALTLGGACFGFALIAWGRCAFFSCLKKTHVKLLFLALRRSKKSASSQ